MCQLLQWIIEGNVEKERVKKKIRKRLKKRGSLPTIVMLDSGYKWHVARVVPKKGKDPYAIKSIGKHIENMGYNKMIIKSDQEPSIKDLIRAIKRERPESIEEMVPEESEVGEHQSNGMVERAIQTINGQALAMKIGIQQRYKERIDNDHTSGHG